MAADSSNDFKIYSRATERKPLPEDPILQGDIEHVLEHGFVVLPDCFSKAEAKEARHEIIRLLKKDGVTLGYGHCSRLNTYSTQSRKIKVMFGKQSA